MPNLIYGLSDAQGSPVGGTLSVAGVVINENIVYDVTFPETVDAAQGWFMTLPKDGTLVAVESFGAGTTEDWVSVPGTQSFHYFFGVSGVNLKARVIVRLGVALVPRAREEDILDVARVSYPVFVPTQQERDEIVAYLRRAVRVTESTENDLRLWQLFQAALREAETYCHHALRQRSFRSRIVFHGPDTEPRLCSVNGSWRTLQSVEAVTLEDVPVVVDRSGHFYGASDLVYQATFTLGPVDGPSEGFADDVRDGLARLVGYRWDGGIFQRSALWQSGCLDALSHYVNREAQIL